MGKKKKVFFQNSLFSRSKRRTKTNFTQLLKLIFKSSVGYQKWWSEVGVGVEQGRKCGMFGRI
jgi:hypothetical protein